MKKLLTYLAFVSIFLPAIRAQQKPASSQTDPFIVEALSMIRGDSLLAYIQALQDFETRFMIAPNHREVATWIMEKFLSFGVPEVRLDSFLCQTVGFGFDTITWQYNVEAKILGGDHADQEILTMGHYDSFVSSWSGDPMISAPGTNDNTSRVRLPPSKVPASSWKWIISPKKHWSSWPQQPKNSCMPGSQAPNIMLNRPTTTKGTWP